MTRDQVDKIILHDDIQAIDLIETHISWVLLGERFAFKIKKPIKYSFLDFSTLENRKHYCNREVELNRRVSDNLYLDVQPVKEHAEKIFIGSDAGEIIDYAVRMRKLDRQMQMDILLKNNKVTPGDVQALARKIASFHKSSPSIYEKDLDLLRYEFNDLTNEKSFLSQYLSPSSYLIIDKAIAVSDIVLQQIRDRLEIRLKRGFFKDCHGDLHSRNIFLLPNPQPFDCIEFNDALRSIDILNEVAFLCMDLDSFGRQDLSEIFLHSYNKLLPAIETGDDERLFCLLQAIQSECSRKGK